jgi:alcohol dehydrogenase
VVQKLTYEPYTPTELLFGDGVFGEAGRHALELGRSALVVTSRNATDKWGYLERLIRNLEQFGLDVSVFQGVSPGPTTEEVDQGASHARANGVDLVVALGGGSVLDCAKAVAGVASCGGSATDYLYGKRQVTADAIPILAIPTLPGTGSELNKSAIIRDPVRHYKNGIRSAYLFPRKALVDPRLTYSAPRGLTAQTGFDILTHAVESYVSPKAQPEADALALNAVQAVIRWLPIAIEQPRHAEARAFLSFAGASMGVNLSCVGTCFPHRADKALCALHPEIAHGQSLALFYPYWANISYKGAIARFAQLSRLLDPLVCSLSEDRQAASFSDLIDSFIRRIGMKSTMAQLGVDPEEIPALAERVAGDLSINPVPIQQERLLRILTDIVHDSGAFEASTGKRGDPK